MKESVKKLIYLAENDPDFLRDIYLLDGSKKPGFFSGEIEKHIFASAYIGYILAKFGPNDERIKPTTKQ